jgi:D-alanine-D-alanine ligase
MGMLEDSSHKSQVTSHTINLRDLTIGVFRGGISSERDISLLSGENVLKALGKRGYKVVGVDVITTDPKEIMAIIRDKAIDIVFIALHGKFGEDGGIQKIFEDNRVIFTGSGSKASFSSMDKTESRRILQEVRLSPGSQTPCLRFKYGGKPGQIQEPSSQGH